MRMWQILFGRQVRPEGSGDLKNVLGTPVNEYLGSERSQQQVGDLKSTIMAACAVPGISCCACVQMYAHTSCHVIVRM